MLITVRITALVTLLVTIKFVSSTLTNDIDTRNQIGSITEEIAKMLTPDIENEQYIREVHSMYNTYKGDMLARRMEIETNDLIDSKFKTGKRNVDLINSILGLPKGLHDAGR